MHRTEAMEDFIINYLDQHVPRKYCYHNLGHTLYVVSKVVEIGNEENCTEDEITLLRTAAFWHDSGYAVSYKDHEIESCNLARKHLPGFGYSGEEIDAMCGIILATQIPQTPQNKLEQIIADADLEYLGTEHAETISERLFQELKLINSQLSKNDWNHVQINFLQQHQYFTAYCKKYKEPVKQAYIQKLKEMLV